MIRVIQPHFCISVYPPPLPSTLLGGIFPLGRFVPENRVDLKTKVQKMSKGKTE